MENTGTKFNTDITISEVNGQQRDSSPNMVPILGVMAKDTLGVRADSDHAHVKKEVDAKQNNAADIMRIESPGKGGNRNISSANTQEEGPSLASNQEHSQREKRSFCEVDEHGEENMDINIKDSSNVISTKTVSKTGAPAKDALQEGRRELPRRLEDWSKGDMEYFARAFDAAESIEEVRKLVPGMRNEKIAKICLNVIVGELQIDWEKVKKWIFCGGNTRSRSPVVKVCGDGEYIRISSALVERFGLKFEKGQEFELRVMEIDGKDSIALVPLK